MKNPRQTKQHVLQETHKEPKSSDQEENIYQLDSVKNHNSSRKLIIIKLVVEEKAI